MFKKICKEVYVFLPLYMFGIARIVNSSSVSDRNVEDINLTESLSSNNSAKCNVFPIGVDTLKTQILARLKIEDDNASGYIHFPDFLDEEFFLQLTAEKLVKRYVKGIPKMEFKRLRPRNAFRGPAPGPWSSPSPARRRT